MPESVFKLDDNSLDPVSRSTIEERETIAPVLSPEERINARREAWRNLNAARNYLNVIQDFLAIGDTAGAIYADSMMSGYLAAYRRNLEPVRAEFGQRAMKREG
jgi:hypothetical protein